MDFDGRGVRQLTSHKSIAISPSGANGKIVYTSYVRLFPLLWTMDGDGGNKREVPTGVDLNASPSLSAGRSADRLRRLGEGQFGHLHGAGGRRHGAAADHAAGPSRPLRPGLPRGARSSTPRI